MASNESLDGTVESNGDKATCVRVWATMDETLGWAGGGASVSWTYCKTEKVASNSSTASIAKEGPLSVKKSRSNHGLENWTGNPPRLAAWARTGGNGAIFR